MDACQLIGRAWLLALGFVAINASAQAQEASALALFTPVSGYIENGAPQSWTFTAASDAVLSFKVEASSRELDPVLEIVDSTGTVLIGNDDYDYPDSRDSMLEAITIPRTDTYTARVSGFEGASGEYTLTMLAGFADIGHSENFNAVSNWRARSEGLDVDIADGNLLLALAGVQQTGIALNRDMETLADFYAQVGVSVVSSQSGWIVGLTARQQDDETYYLLEVNNSGQWRFAVHTSDGERVLRDWATHPAIGAERTDFTLGLMAQSRGFDFFYNGQLFGQVADTTLEGEGRIGLVAATTDSLTSTTVVQFDDLTITVPLVVHQTTVLPQQLILNPPQAMIRELEHRHLVPAGGQMSLIVEESFVESSRPGVHRFMLGRGTTFTNFVLAARVSWQTLVEGAAGCGLIFRSADETHYTLAYLDQTGGYGVSQRDGDTFEPGVFGENSAWAGGTRHLLVIANGDTVHYYIDGYHVGTLENTAIEGEIGNAVVNFDPIHTSCQFGDTWVWRWP
jgi:hypothetical protein